MIYMHLIEEAVVVLRNLLLMLKGTFDGAWVVARRIVERISRRIGESRIGEHSFDELCPDGQCHRSTLTFRCAVEMDGALFATYPCTTDESGSEGHEPAIGVVVGSTRLAAHGSCDAIA